MYPAPFEYHAAQSVEEAVALLREYQEDAKLLAGGHSLLPLMKLRYAQPKHLIDVRRIPGMSGIREVGDSIIIGATTTHHELESSVLLRSTFPALTDAACQIGDAQVRNAGTIGGSLAHADPGADLPAVMLACDAQFTVVGLAGPRRIRASDFFVGLLTTALNPTEVLTEIRLTAPPERTGGAYVKFPHPASRYAVLGIAVQLTLSEADTVHQVRVGVTGLAASAYRAAATEKALTGRTPEPQVIAEAAAAIAEGVEVRGDPMGGAAYKTAIAAVYARRAIARALERAA